MNSKQWAVGLGTAAAVVAIAIAGCTGDTTNNYQSILGEDSGIDVQVLQTLGCSAGKKECISDTVARVCPSDGSSWIAVTCRVGEKCDQGDCKPVAGGPTAACVPGDGACLPNNKALRCKADGSGFEQLDCPANTTCIDKGVCKGAYAVGSSTCSADRKSVSLSTDGFHTTTTACNAGEYCVSVSSLPYSQAACKPAQCKPSSAGAACGEQTQCGDPSNSNNDQTKFLSSCTETPDGWKWIGTACPTGQTCNPYGTQCLSGNKFQAACSGNSCTPGSTRCSPNGQGIQTCKSDGTWDATVTQCNSGAGERCIAVFGQTGKAVCGDPVCANGLGVCDDATNGFRACDPTTGKLGNAQPCATGFCVKVSYTGNPYPQDYVGRCQLQCTPGQENCYGSDSFQVCAANGRWSATQACPSPDGATSTCTTYTDPVSGVSKHLCLAGSDVCTPGNKRCVNGDGGSASVNGTDSVQICGADGHWGTPQTCSVGVCTTGYTGGAQCVADCIPGTNVCDPTGSGKYLVCPTNGKLSVSPAYDQTCPANTACKRAGPRSFGCIQCVGPMLTDNNYVEIPESRCLLEDGGANGSTQLQGCKADNTWDTAVVCSGGTSRCASTYQASPSVDPGGVRYAYCY